MIDEQPLHNEHNEHCDTCGKASFPSPTKAQGLINALRRHRYSRGRRKSGSSSSTLPNRAYECPDGNGWHITTQHRRRK